VAVVVCAATRSELSACERGFQSSGVPAAAFEALLTGVGPVHAEKNVGDRLARGQLPSLVVSSGFAGVLRGAVGVGTWVTATRLAECRNGARVDLGEVVLRQAPAPALRCALVSADRILRGEMQPCDWPPGSDDESVLAVDMESAAIARAAADRGVAVMVLRLASDTPERPLPGFLTPFAASMAATRVWPRLVQAAHGVRGALGDPRGVARIVRDGRAWERDLARGWEHFARLVA